MYLTHEIKTSATQLFILNGLMKYLSLNRTSVHLNSAHCRLSLDHSLKTKLIKFVPLKFD